MRQFRRADGFEVQDEKNRDLDWVRKEFGHGVWVEVAVAQKVVTVAERRLMQIAKRLDKIDLASIRPLREGNAVKLAELEAEAVALRAERTELLKG